MTKEEMATDKQKDCIANYIYNDNEYAIKLLNKRKVSQLTKREAWEIINKTVKHHEMMMCINAFVGDNDDYPDNDISDYEYYGY